ncbi:sec7 domain-containing protein [Cyclospora cayetanensis]|uniref:Sec7 domain-containing protein n=1 Tax=Cyclospora cayetanensis TaxID=88456 RepID=A0A1D3DAE9_9EIME|nr:sec7 domain-containing protein [Cyclospora cayetanensis]
MASHRAETDAEENTSALRHSQPPSPLQREQAKICIGPSPPPTLPPMKLPEHCAFRFDRTRILAVNSRHPPRAYRLQLPSHPAESRGDRIPVSSPRHSTASSLFSPSSGGASSTGPAVEGVPPPLQLPEDARHQVPWGGELSMLSSYLDDASRRAIEEDSSSGSSNSGNSGSVASTPEGATSASSASAASGGPYYHSLPPPVWSPLRGGTSPQLLSYRAYTDRLFCLELLGALMLSELTPGSLSLRAAKSKDPLAQITMHNVCNVFQAIGSRRLVDTPTALPHWELVFIERLVVTVLRICLRLLSDADSLLLPLYSAATPALQQEASKASTGRAEACQVAIHLLQLLTLLHPNVFCMHVQRISQSAIILVSRLNLKACSSPLLIQVLLALYQRLVPLPAFLPTLPVPQQHVATRVLASLASWIRDAEALALLVLQHRNHYPMLLQTLMAFCIYVPPSPQLSGAAAAEPTAEGEMLSRQGGSSTTPAAPYEANCAALAMLGALISSIGEALKAKGSAVAAHLAAAASGNSAAAGKGEAAGPWKARIDCQAMWLQAMQVLAIVCSFSVRPVKVKALAELQQALIRCSRKEPSPKDVSLDSAADPSALCLGNGTESPQKDGAFEGQQHSREPQCSMPWMALPMRRRLTPEVAMGTFGIDECSPTFTGAAVLRLPALLYSLVRTCLPVENPVFSPQVYQRKAAAASLACRLFLTKMELLLRPFKVGGFYVDITTDTAILADSPEQRGVSRDHPGGIEGLLPPLTQLVQLLVTEAQHAPVVYRDAFLESMKNTLLVVLTCPSVAASSIPSILKTHIAPESILALIGLPNQHQQQSPVKEEAQAPQGLDEEDQVAARRAACLGALSCLSDSQRVIVSAVSPFVGSAFPGVVQELLLILPTPQPPPPPPRNKSPSGDESTEDHCAEEVTTNHVDTVFEEASASDSKNCMQNADRSPSNPGDHTAVPLTTGVANTAA